MHKRCVSVRLMRRVCGDWRRRWLLLAVFSGGALLPLLIPAFALATGAAPNIVFILCDDLGIGDTGVTNQNARAAAGLPSFATPNIDLIAQQGVRFNNMYAGAPTCSASRAAMLTGFHQAHTYFDWWASVEQDIRGGEQDRTWGQSLQQAGYETGVFGKWHLGGAWANVRKPDAVPPQKGFEETYVYYASQREWIGWEDDGAGSVQRFYVPPDPEYAGPGNHYVLGDKIAGERAVDFIRSRANGSQPFAAYVPFQSPHTPLYQVEPNHPYANATYTSGPLMGQLWPQAQRDYAGMIHNLDQRVGKILQAIDDPNGDGNASDSVADNTIVIFSSDNGPTLNDPSSGFQIEFFDSNSSYFGGKFLVWGGGVRTPFFVRWPDKIAPGSVNSDHVGSFADILPTFAELTGQDVPLGIDGTSMLDTLTGEATATPAHVMGWAQSREVGPSNPAGWAVRVGDWWLYKGKPTSFDTNVTYRLYNLAQDPNQLGASQHNIRPDIRAALEQIGIAEGFDREPMGPSVLAPGLMDVKHVYFTQYKNWTPSGSSDFFSAGNWSGGTQNVGFANTPDALNWNTGPADNWLATMANVQGAPQEVSVNADAKVLALELRGQAGAMTLQVGPDATLTARNGVRISSGGTLRLNGGEVNTVRDVDIRAGGRLEGEGLIDGQQAVIAGIPEFANLGLFEPNVVNGGVLSVADAFDPQSSAGRLFINGDYEQHGQGVLKLDLFANGSLGGTDFDQLAASGKVTLGGLLEISIPNPLNLALGNSFPIITAGGGLFGAFDQIVAPMLDGGLAWSMQYGAGSALLQVVEQSYLAGWRQSFGINAGGDLDLDGDTDGADFLRWQRGLGASVANVGSVPEPSTLSLALVVGCLARTTRRLARVRGRDLSAAAR